MVEQPANRLKELCEAKHLERHDVCAHLRECGLPASEDTVRRLERGGAIPTKYLPALIALLECTTDRLLGYDRHSPADQKAAA